MRRAKVEGQLVGFGSAEDTKQRQEVIDGDRSYLDAPKYPVSESNGGVIRTLAGVESVVTVMWGEEKFTPRPYCTLTVGPFSMTTPVRAGETEVQAMERAHATLAAFAEKVRLEKFRSYQAACAHIFSDPGNDHRSSR